MLIDDVNQLIDQYPDSYEFLEIPNVEEVESEIITTTRWDIINRVVFKRNSEYVAVEYATGATEYQDAEPEAVAYEVHPVIVEVTRYQRSK